MPQSLHQLIQKQVEWGTDQGAVPHTKGPRMLENGRLNARKLLSREGFRGPLRQQVKHVPAMHPHSNEGPPNLSCIRSAECRPRNVILPLYSALVRSHLDCGVQVSPAQHKEDIEFSRKFQKKAMMLKNGTEALFMWGETERVKTFQMGENKF